MPLPEEQRAKALQRYLYLAYAVAGVGLIVSIWRGWFTQAWFTTEVAPAVILALIFVTVLKRGPESALQAPASYTPRRAIVDVSKALLSWVCMIAWIFLTARRVPDNYVGVAIIFVPSLALGLWGVVNFFRASRIVTGGIFGAVFTPRTAPSVVVDQVAADPLPVGTAADVIEIQVDYGALLLRLLVSLLLYTAAWWVLGRDNVFISALFVAGTVFLLYLNGRMLIGHGPGLVITPSGISIRKGLGLVSNLAWSDATTLEIKSTPLYSCLVIGMRNAERLIDSASGYRRWALRSNLQRFGSPFLVSTSALKCDRNQLFQTITAYRARYGKT
jgi:hypothetical protein